MWRTLRTLIVLAAIAGLGYWLLRPSDEERYDEHFARARTHRDAGRAREASIEYRSAIDALPNRAEAHYELGVLLIGARHLREALWELSEAARIDPQHDLARLKYAQLSVNSGKTEQEIGLRFVRDVLRRDPEGVEALLIEGQVLDALGRRDESIVSYRRAAQLDPQSKTAQRVLAWAEFRQGDRAAAERLFRRVIEIAPTSSAWAELGNFLATAPEDGQGDASGPSDRSDEAEQALRYALELAQGEERQTYYRALTSFYLERDRFDEACGLLEQGIAKESDPLPLIYALANIHRKAGNEAKADELIEQATRVRPQDPRTFELLARERGVDGDLERALIEVEQALALDPKRNSSLLIKAELLMQLEQLGKRPGGLAEARPLIDAVLASGRDRAAAQLLSAQQYQQAGDGEAAVAAYRAALAEKPDWAQALLRFGLFLVAQKDYLSARAELAKAVEIAPGLLSAKRALAELHARLGEWDAAIARAREVLRLHPADVQLRLMAAEGLWRTGATGDALALLEALPEDQRPSEIHLAIGRILQKRGNLEAARKSLVAAREGAADRVPVLVRLLQLDLAEGHVDEARRWIAEAIASDPKDARLRRIQGLLEQREGRLAEAEAAFRMAIELDPSELTNYRDLANALLADKRIDATIEAMEQASQARPEEVAVHYFLGVLRELAGRRDEAIASYEAALGLAPDFAVVQNNLAFLLAEKGEQLDRALELARSAKAELPDEASAADTLGWVLYRKGMVRGALPFLEEADALCEGSGPQCETVRAHLETVRAELAARPEGSAE